MIAYFDTSALIPLLIDEPGSAMAGKLWDEADHVVSVRLVYAEARAALAQAHRFGRLDDDLLVELVHHLDGLYAQFDRIEVDDVLVRRAGVLAEEQALRGYDAVHLAAVERVADEQTVLVSGDDDLCQAAQRLGVAISNTSVITNIADQHEAADDEQTEPER